MFVLWSLALVVSNYLLFFSSPPTTRAFLSSGDDGGEWHCFYPYQKQVLLLKTRVLGVFRIHGVSSFQCWLLLRKQLSGCAFGRQSWCANSECLTAGLPAGRAEPRSCLCSVVLGLSMEHHSCLQTISKPFSVLQIISKQVVAGVSGKHCLV